MQRMASLQRRERLRLVQPLFSVKSAEISGFEGQISPALLPDTHKLLELPQNKSTNNCKLQVWEDGSLYTVNLQLGGGGRSTFCPFK